MFSAPSGVPTESESVSCSLCSQQLLLLSRSGYWGLHKPNLHAVRKWLPISVCVCVAPPMVSLAPWQLKPKHLWRLAPWGALFFIAIKDTYAVWEAVEQHLTQRIKNYAYIVWTDCDNSQCFCGYICWLFSKGCSFITTACFGKTFPHKMRINQCRRQQHRRFLQCISFS